MEKIDKPWKRIKNVWKYPHVRAIIWTIVVCIISGVLSIALIDCREAIAAILASICAGCVTGVAFYVITNKRNNEIRVTKEEYDEANKNYELARRIMHLCSDAITGVPDSEKNIKDICDLTSDLLTYMATLCFDAPKTTKIIKDYSKEYGEKTESAFKAIDELEKKALVPLDEDQINKDLGNIMLFCSATKGVLIEPWIQLMSDVDQLEKSDI